jgi:dienelactone hydrolase
MRACAVAAVLAAAAGLAACGGGDGEKPRPALRPIPPAGSGGPADARAVGFRSLDGTGLRGRLFGNGTTAVVLSHMGDPTDSEEEWYPLARRLARRGYLVLTYNRQGICAGEKPRYDCSAGYPDYPKEWKDIVGAVRFAQASGAKSVAIAGASIGGTGSLYAAQTGLIHPAAVISLAGANYISTYQLEREQLQRIGGAKLFISGRNDPSRGAKWARQWTGWARAPKQLALLPSSRHGTDMLAPGQPTRRPLEALLVRFLERYAPA